MSEWAKCQPGNTQNDRTVLPIVNLMADSESGNPNFYSRFIVTIRLSRLVSEIFVRDRQRDRQTARTIPIAGHCRRNNNWKKVTNNEVLLTEVNTSCVSCIVEILVHPNFWNSLILAGLCSVAEGCVRKKRRKRPLSDNAGELDPYDNWKHTERLLVVSEWAEV